MWCKNDYQIIHKQFLYTKITSTKTSIRYAIEKDKREDIERERGRIITRIGTHEKKVHKTMMRIIT